MLHTSELSVRTAKPQIDDLVVLLGELLPVLDLSRQVGELLPESDVLVDEILPLILRSVDGKVVDSQTDVPREGGMHRRPLAFAEALERHCRLSLVQFPLEKVEPLAAPHAKAFELSRVEQPNRNLSIAKLQILQVFYFLQNYTCIFRNRMIHLRQRTEDCLMGIDRKELSETGKRIKARRKEIGMSAEELADRIGVSHATMYRYENGGIERVTTKRLGEIAAVLRVSPDYLLVGYDPPATPAPGDDRLSSEINELITLAKSSTPEEVQQMIRIFRAMKGE